MKRIFWRNFVKTRAYAYMQTVLAMFDAELIIEWKLDPNGEIVTATDVYIVKTGTQRPG